MGSVGYCNNKKKDNTRWRDVKQESRSTPKWDIRKLTTRVEKNDALIGKRCHMISILIRGGHAGKKRD